MTVTPDADRLVELESIASMLGGILERVENLYTQEGQTLPDRRYWTLAQPADDCEQLVVFFNQAYYGPPGDEATEPVRCDGPRSAALTVRLTRCIPTIGTRRAPAAADIQAGSKQLAVDAYLLLESVRLFEMWDPYGGPGLGVIATVDAEPPGGGLQSVTLNLTMAIP